MESFKGSLLFSSINQLNFLKTSRRDDMMSMFYLLIYLLHRGNMPGIGISDDCDPSDIFDEIKIIRDGQP
jgi:hypothetical protein